MNEIVFKKIIFISTIIFVALIIIAFVLNGAYLHEQKENSSEPKKVAKKVIEAIKKENSNNAYVGYYKTGDLIKNQRMLAIDNGIIIIKTKEITEEGDESILIEYGKWRLNEKKELVATIKERDSGVGDEHFYVLVFALDNDGKLFANSFDSSIYKASDLVFEKITHEEWAKN
ncbi:MAG: hypothetical protein WCX30_02170 [Candidatus Paceibacterota bacterium]|jgi:hypothetical protein|nr:hypothetical protein [bacterium]